MMCFNIEATQTSSWFRCSFVLNQPRLPAFPSVSFSSRYIKLSIMNLKKKKKRHGGGRGRGTRVSKRTLAAFFRRGVTCWLLVRPSSGLHTSTNAAPHPALSRQWARQAFPGLLPKPEGDPNPAHGRRDSAGWWGSSGVG